jgi:hypothetical protein
MNCTSWRAQIVGQRLLRQDIDSDAWQLVQDVFDGLLREISRRRAGRFDRHGTGAFDRALAMRTGYVRSSPICWKTACATPIPAVALSSMVRSGRL